MSTAAADRFWARAKRMPSGCWEWSGSTKGSNGYGRTWWEGRVVYVHRLAFFLTNGRWPRLGFLVCHRCDNRICVNSEHLYEGTQAENNRDWIAAKSATRH